MFYERYALDFKNSFQMPVSLGPSLYFWKSEYIQCELEHNQNILVLLIYSPLGIYSVI